MRERAAPNPYAPWSTLGELIRARALARPDGVRIAIDGRTLTYAELDAQSDRVAQNLRAAGVRKGDRVACLMFNCVEQLLVWIGTVKIGAVWVPINASVAGNDLQHVLDDASPSLIFIDDDNEPKLDAVRFDGLQVKVGRVSTHGRGGFEQFLREHEPIEREAAIAPGDPAVILYTGGTTGLPKGVVLPHFAWIAAGMRYVEALGITAGDRHYSVLPMFHVGGLMAGLIGPIYADIPTTLDRWFSASAFWQRVNDTGATVVDPIGTMFAVLAKSPPHALERSHRVRVATGAFGQLPWDTVQGFADRFGIGFVNLYSLSEGGGLMIVNNPLGSTKPQSNGRASRWVDIMIADAQGFPAPAGVQGEILLRPRIPHTFMLGYHNAPERTAQVLQGLWLHTGDLGHLDEEGYLYFTGRQAHFLRRRGENISAHEVEAVVATCPGVFEVAVVGVPSDLGEDDVKAFVIASPNATPDPRAVFDWCRERLAYFKVPRYVEFVADFPRSAAKREIERHKLKALPHDAAWDAEKVVGRLTAKR
ncbi:class I adenylate-forming enzyme family protein [Ramlibacter sp.]|uniref:class I adenylate-forming enzyme family protein n=1 Tax=Ramlibacter sp. TaxID=1917967 RepID=UPI003D132A72